LEKEKADCIKWLDRLVQRFEVTKKLYEFYPPGFRKGEGDNSFIKPYWLLAMCLYLFYVQTNEIKYLSTLLKVSDLLCSLPHNALKAAIPGSGMVMLLTGETLSIRTLSNRKGITYDVK
jgi:hypothetical protein